MLGFRKHWRVTIVELLCLSLILSGCVAEDISSETSGQYAERAYDIAIIHANRSNSSGDLNVGSIEGLLGSMISEARPDSKGYLVAISADGRPQYLSGTFEMQEENGRRRDKEIEDNIAQVRNFNWNASTPESNLFDAIRIANDQLASGDATDRENLLIIVDSGISTTGPINFTEPEVREGLYNPAEFIEKLREEGTLGKFGNIDKVVWYGLGETSDPQVAPNEGAKKAMKNFYRALFEAAGVPLSENDDEVFLAGSGVLPSGELPEVSSVEMPRISLDESGEPVGFGATLEFGESGDEGQNIRFAFGSNTIEDEDAVREMLQPYIDQIIDFPSIHVTISGFTDTVGSEESNQLLSQERAEAVKKLFVEAGVPDQQLTAVGRGESETYSSDEENRRVEILFDE